MVLCNGPLAIGYPLWQREEDKRKGFNITLSTSGGNAIDPELQDNVLIPEDFTKYIHHVGNVSEMYSIIRDGLIPGGRRLKGKDNQ